MCEEGKVSKVDRELKVAGGLIPFTTFSRRYFLSMKEKDKKHAAVIQKETGSPSLVQRLLPHIAAVALFAAVNFMYFSPMLLDSKEIYQSDIVQFKGMSKELIDFRAKTGHEGLWTNSMFGGMPAFQISVLY